MYICQMSRYITCFGVLHQTVTVRGSCPIELAASVDASGRSGLCVWGLHFFFGTFQYISIHFLRLPLPCPKCLWCGVAPEDL